MSLVLERGVWTVISNGVADYTADPTKFDPLFQGSLETDELARMKQYWGAKPPDVIHGYPRADANFPLCAIMLGNEKETSTYLADDLGEIALLGNGNLGYGHGRRYETRYDLYLYVDNPIVAVWYYYVIKQILLERQDALTALGLENISISGGDMVPMPQYMPDNVFTRVIRLSGEYEEVWEEDSGVEQGAKVEGAFLGDAAIGGPGDGNPPPDGGIGLP